MPSLMCVCLNMCVCHCVCVFFADLLFFIPIFPWISIVFSHFVFLLIFECWRWFCRSKKQQNWFDLHLATHRFDAVHAVIFHTRARARTTQLVCSFYCGDRRKCDSIVPLLAAGDAAAVADGGEMRGFFGEIFFAAGCKRLRSFRKSAERQNGDRNKKRMKKKTKQISENWNGYLFFAR